MVLTCHRRRSSQIRSDKNGSGMPNKQQVYMYIFRMSSAHAGSSHETTDELTIVGVHPTPIVDLVDLDDVDVLLATREAEVMLIDADDTPLDPRRGILALKLPKVKKAKKVAKKTTTKCVKKISKPASKECKDPLKTSERRRYVSRAYHRAVKLAIAGGMELEAAKGAGRAAHAKAGKEFDLLA